MHSIFRLHLLHIKVCKYRRSHWRWSVKKVFLKLSRNSQANTCQSLFFNKVAEWGLQTEASFEKETPRQVLSCEFCEILKKIFLTEHLWMIASIGTISSWIFLKCFFFFFFKITVVNFWLGSLSSILRSNHPNVLCENVLKNFPKFTGKFLCKWPQACNFIRKEALPQVFSCEFCKIFKNFYRTAFVTASIYSYF